MIWVGTSGWQYRDWRGRFYPSELPQERWLAWYADRFPTVEVNNTFYRLPERSAFERWREQTPSGTMISVKVSRYLTHTLRLRDPREPIERLWARAEALGPRLGALLFQLPPRFTAEPERLRAVLSFVPAGVEAAFEFRDPSWDRPEVYRVLEERNAALVWADRLGQTSMPRADGGPCLCQVPPRDRDTARLSERRPAPPRRRDRRDGCSSRSDLLQQRSGRCRDSGRGHDDRASSREARQHCRYAGEAHASHERGIVVQAGVTPVQIFGDG